MPQSQPSCQCNRPPDRHIASSRGRQKSCSPCSFRISIKLYCKPFVHIRAQQNIPELKRQSLAPSEPSKQSDSSFIDLQMLHALRNQRCSSKGKQRLYTKGERRQIGQAKLPFACLNDQIGTKVDWSSCKLIDLIVQKTRLIDKIAFKQYNNLLRMRYNIDSEQDELNQFLGKSTGRTSYAYYNQEFQFLDIDPPLDTFTLRFDDPLEQIPQQPCLAKLPEDQTFIIATSFNSPALDTFKVEAIYASGSQKERDRVVRRKEKNSNAIKKIGRIILDNLREYRRMAGNTPVCNMLKMLSKNSKVGRTEVNKRDKFNTYHLRALFSSKDAQLIAHNLKTTRVILSRHLRQNVLSSRQISDCNKALYLNTMKCSVLRCSNKALAVRLQIAAQQ